MVFQGPPQIQEEPGNPPLTPESLPALSANGSGREWDDAAAAVGDHFQGAIQDCIEQSEEKTNTAVSDSKKALQNANYLLTTVAVGVLQQPTAPEKIMAAIQGAKSSCKGEETFINIHRLPCELSSLHRLRMHTKSVLQAALPPDVSGSWMVGSPLPAFASCAACSCTATCFACRAYFLVWSWVFLISRPCFCLTEIICSCQALDPMAAGGVYEGIKTAG